MLSSSVELSDVTSDFSRTLSTAETGIDDNSLIYIIIIVTSRKIKIFQLTEPKLRLQLTFATKRKTKIPQFWLTVLKQKLKLNR